MLAFLRELRLHRNYLRGEDKALESATARTVGEGNWLSLLALLPHYGVDDEQTVYRRKCV